MVFILFAVIGAILAFNAIALVISQWSFRFMAREGLLAYEEPRMKTWALGFTAAPLLGVAVSALAFVAVERGDPNSVGFWLFVALLLSFLSAGMLRYQREEIRGWTTPRGQ